MGRLIDALFNRMIGGQYDKLEGAAETGKWYEVDTPGAVSADGTVWHGFMKKGSENKVIVCFFGGGVSPDEYTAARGYSAVKEGGAYSDTFSQGMYAMAGCIARFGIGSRGKKNPFRNWSVIVVPYATGDFHIGCGEVEYTALTGEKKTLYHHGCLNFRLMMKEALKHIEAKKTDTVLVTGGSAGGFGSALLADDVFDYFPHASHLAVAVDAGLMVSEKWRDAAVNRWHAPKEICDRLKTDNITVDSLVALSRKRGKSVKILFDCAVRDAALSTFQAYLYGIDHAADRKDGDMFQSILKRSVERMRDEIPGIGVYIFEKITDKENALMQHTILSVPFAFRKFCGNKNPVQWVYDCIYGNVESYGLELLEKEY